MNSVFTNLDSLPADKEPQRVNVMLSRARHGQIIVGNSETLRASKKGKATWVPLLDKLESDGRLVAGLPSFCQVRLFFLKPTEMFKVIVTLTKNLTGTQCSQI